MYAAASSRNWPRHSRRGIPLAALGRRPRHRPSWSRSYAAYCILSLRAALRRLLALSLSNLSRDRSRQYGPRRHQTARSAISLLRCAATQHQPTRMPQTFLLKPSSLSRPRPSPSRPLSPSSAGIPTTPPSLPTTSWCTARQRTSWRAVYVAGAWDCGRSRLNMAASSIWLELISHGVRCEVETGGGENVRSYMPMSISRILQLLVRCSLSARATGRRSDGDGEGLRD